MTLEGLKLYKKYLKLAHCQANTVFIPSQHDTFTFIGSMSPVFLGLYSRTSYDNIVGFWWVEMAISTNPKPTIYRNLAGS